MTLQQIIEKKCDEFDKKFDWENYDKEVFDYFCQALTEVAKEAMKETKEKLEGAIIVKIEKEHTVPCVDCGRPVWFGKEAPTFCNSCVLSGAVSDQQAKGKEFGV